MTKKSTFEKDMQRLEELVRKLEQEELGLEESLQAFEEGMRLAGALSKLLEKAEERVLKLTENAEGKPVLETFDDDGEKENE